MLMGYVSSQEGTCTYVCCSRSLKPHFEFPAPTPFSASRLRSGCGQCKCSRNFYQGEKHATFQHIYNIQNAYETNAATSTPRLSRICTKHHNTSFWKDCTKDYTPFKSRLQANELQKMYLGLIQWKGKR